MTAPLFKFVYLDGALVVRRAADLENHYALAYEVAEEQGIEIDSMRDLAGGDLYGDVAELRVLFWREVEDNERLRTEVEEKLAAWGLEHRVKLVYPPDLRI